MPSAPTEDCGTLPYDQREPSRDTGMADSPSKSSRYASPTMFGSGWVTPYSARMSSRDGAVTRCGVSLSKNRLTPSTGNRRSVVTPVSRLDVGSNPSVGRVKTDCSFWYIAIRLREPTSPKEYPSVPPRMDVGATAKMPRSSNRAVIVPEPDGKRAVGLLKVICPRS